MENKEKEPKKGGKALFVLGLIILIIGIGMFIMGPSIISPFKGGTIFIFLGMALFMVGGIIMGVGSARSAGNKIKGISHDVLNNKDEQTSLEELFGGQSVDSKKENDGPTTCPCCGARKAKSSDKCKYCGN